MKVAIIIPYFGKFPVYFDLFLYSCSLNNGIDWIFFTDCEIPIKVYPNTIFKQVSFKDYCKRVSDELNISFSPQTPYKLCDLKPFYGVIHKTELNGYDFWGFGDCDLIYGDLMSFFKEKFERYNFITTHRARVAGHLTFVKNNSRYTTMCFKIPYWQDKLCDHKHHGLDEAEYTALVYPGYKFFARLFNYILNPLRIIKDETYFNLINALFCNRLTKVWFKEYYTTPLPSPEDIYISKKNKVFRGNDCFELPYIHFLFFKKTPYVQTDKYWNDGYYKISNIERMIATEREVMITLDGISVK